MTTTSIPTTQMKTHQSEPLLTQDEETKAVVTLSDHNTNVYYVVQLKQMMRC